MNDKTKTEYRSIARYFYKKNNILLPTAKLVCDALKKCAVEYRPDYWRRIRSALALVAYENASYKAADTIIATKNPITNDRRRRNEIKTKQKRQCSVSTTDEKQLMDYLFIQKEKTVFAAVTLVSYLGCRPAELMDLAFFDDQTVLITSAKKTDDGKRGLDRTLHINDEALFKSLKMSHSFLLEATVTDPIRYVQRRLDTLTQRVWPKRKVRPSLYSWRHQMGSDLKASGMNACEVAAVMGHRSIESVNVYGNRRSAQNTRSNITPSKETVRYVERINKHRIETKPNNDPMPLI